MAKKTAAQQVRLKTYTGAGSTWARRHVAEELRDLSNPVDIGYALLQVFQGVDPFVRQRNEDRKRAQMLHDEPVTLEPEPTIEWQHRLKALTTYLNYAYGRPMAGQDVSAEIDRRVAVVGQQNAKTIDVTKLKPEARAVLRQALQSAIVSGAVTPDGGDDD